MRKKIKLTTIFGITALSILIFYFFNPNLNFPRISRFNNLVASSAKNEPFIGTNLSGINDWSTQMPFLDAFKSSRSWLTQSENIWDSDEFKKLDLDDNGWVKSLPNPNNNVGYKTVGTLLYREINGLYRGGKHIVLYDGEGKIEYGFDATKDEVASIPGRDVINVTPSDGGIWLKITATDPNKTGNYIRNIRVVQAADENTYQSEIFNPKFLEKVKDFQVFRFMDWMGTNDSSQGQWRDRPTLESARYSRGGASVEVMVELANRTNIDPWFCMPHQATDEYVSNFARYVKEHLEPERNIYIEYSNEVWNTRFGQYRWVLEQAKKQWPNSNEPDYAQAINWYSKRTTEIIKIWEQVFGDQKARVIGVMAGQAANIWVAQQALAYHWAEQPLSHANYGIDAIAIAPYFGDYIGSPKNQAQTVAWTTEADGGLNKLFEEISQGGVLRDEYRGGALQQAYNWIEQHVEFAKQEGLQLVAYEGGQHLVGTGGMENNQAIANLFIEANRDSRMGTIYQEYLQKWFELGGGLFVNFSDIMRADKWGSWGILEHVDRISSPKYDAIAQFLHRSSKS